MESTETIRTLRESLSEMVKIISWMEKTNEIHQLDIDVMLNKTRCLYEIILSLAAGPIETRQEDPIVFQNIEETEAAFQFMAPASTMESEPESESEPKAIPFPELPVPVPVPVQSPAPVTSPVPAPAPIPEPAQVQVQAPERAPVPTLAPIHLPEPEPEPQQKPGPLATPELPPVPKPEPITAQAPVFTQVPEPKPAIDYEIKVESPHKQQPQLLSQPRDNSLNEALGKKKPVHDIASSLTDIPVADIWSAITINERFLFIRELFGNDPDTFKNTVTLLNSLGSWDAARNFLADRFVWDNNNSVANDFLNVVRRRFLK
jgi:hypothetical protein